MSTELILEVTDLYKTYGRSGIGNRKAAAPAVDGVSFAVKRGETYGLVGESGSGKSTIGKIVYGIETATSGTVALSVGDHTAQEKRGERAKNPVGMIFQNPYSSLNPRRKIGVILDEALRLGGFDKDDYREERCIAALESVGLSRTHASRFPHEMSGGQLQRVAIARALVVEPEMVICDEAVSALDVSVQAQVLNILRDLQQKQGLSYLFITHDMSVARYMSHRVGVLQRGALVEEGDASDLFADPQHEYTRSLIASVPADDPQRRHLVTRKAPGHATVQRERGQ